MKYRIGLYLILTTIFSYACDKSKRTSSGPLSPPSPNVVPTNAVVAVVVSPAQPISTAVGGNTRVAITFTSQNSQAVYSLTASGLSTLPAGWSTAAKAAGDTFTCGNFTTTECVLDLMYSPNAPADGVLALKYSYKSTSSSTAGNDTVSINYSAAAAAAGNHVVPTINPSTSPINGSVKSTTDVTISFSTDIGVATSLNAYFPAGLPSNWCQLDTNGQSCVTTATPSCASVTIDATKCFFKLRFSPQAEATGISTLKIKVLSHK